MQSNPAAERTVLAGIFHYGAEAYFDTCDIVTPKTFTIEENQVIYKCIKHIYDQDIQAKIDIPSIYAAANTLELSFFFDKIKNAQYLQSVATFPVQLTNCRKHAQLIRKLEIANLLGQQLLTANDELKELTGEETLSHILGIPENAIFNFAKLLNHEDSYAHLGADLEEAVIHAMDNPIDQLGISTRYERYDRSLGGGLEPGLHVIAARPKAGKSTLARSIGWNVALSDIPTLYLDTEMMKYDQQARIIAMITGNAYKDIKTGKVGCIPGERNKVIDTARLIKSKPFYYKNIGSMPAFEEQVALIRRWIQKEVGLNHDGTAKPAFIIYDYLKLLETSQLKTAAEYQAIGFMATTLTNIATRYSIPILAFVQLNKDGIDKEGSGVVAQSDRIEWFCSSLFIFKKKSVEEIAQDGSQNGNRKLLKVVSRFSGDEENGDYINYQLEGYNSRLIERSMHSEIINNQNDPTVEKANFKNDEIDNADEIPFE